MRGALTSYVNFHRVNMMGAFADIVCQASHLLYFRSKQAVESEASLKKTGVTLSKTDFPANLLGQRGQLLVIRAKC